MKLKLESQREVYVMDRKLKFSNSRISRVVIKSKKDC